MAKIYAPNDRYTGLIAGVSFSNGVGETEDIWLINWFNEKGYKIVDLNDFKVDELRVLAKEANIEGYDAMKRAELIATLEGGAND